MNPDNLRLILNFPSQRFFKTSDRSLHQYLQLLFQELRERAETSDDKNEALWFADAACLVLEVAIRYETVRPRGEDDYYESK